MWMLPWSLFIEGIYTLSCRKSPPPNAHPSPSVAGSLDYLPLAVDYAFAETFNALYMRLYALQVVELGMLIE